jgi:hypothetical protein
MSSRVKSGFDRFRRIMGNIERKGLENLAKSSATLVGQFHPGQAPAII